MNGYNGFVGWGSSPESPAQNSAVSGKQKSEELEDEIVARPGRITSTKQFD
jgi:hypothetical protein